MSEQRDAWKLGVLSEVQAQVFQLSKTERQASHN